MIWTIAFWQGAGERAIKTAAQTFLATVGVNTLVSLSAINWKVDASITAVATILSLITSIGNASFVAAAVPPPAPAPAVVATPVPVPVVAAAPPVAAAVAAPIVAPVVTIPANAAVPTAIV